MTTETRMIAEITMDEIALRNLAVQARRMQRQARQYRTHNDLSPATHEALTRAAQMLSLVAHDLDEAAGGVE